MWNEVASLVLAWIVVGAGAGVVALLGAAWDLVLETKARPLHQDVVVVYYPAYLRLTVAIFVPVGIVWAWWGSAVAGSTVCLAGTGVAHWMGGVVVADAEGLRASSFWRSDRSLLWSQVERVRYRSFAGRMDFIGEVVTISAWDKMRGLGELAKRIDVALAGRFRDQVAKSGWRVR
jgi:hypothetical protein